MYIQKHFDVYLALITVLMIPATLFSQEDDTKAQAHRDASIKRMQQRVSEIESEMENAELSHAQALGEEAFNLYNQIDQTYLQMKSAYQQQVIELNLRMQRKWEEVESAGVADRDEINEALEQLEIDWDRTFSRLNEAHDSHLKQLGYSLAKLQSEFSDAAGRAKAELEASNFEAVSRWEKSHDLVLAINRTYAQIVNAQLRWEQRESAQNPNEKVIDGRVSRIRARHANTHSRFQQRLTSHIQHLKAEVETRQAQLNATTVWSSRREIMSMVDQLYARSHATFEMLQVSYCEGNQAFEAEMDLLPLSDDRAENLTVSIKEVKTALSDSYIERAEFIEQQIVDFQARIEKGASAEEKATWKAKMTDLRLLARTLEIKAAVLTESTARTVRR